MSSKLLCSIFTLFALATTAACGSCAPDVTARGSASLTWSVAVADTAATCADVGATSVSLRLHPRAGADVTSSFPCVVGNGATAPVTAGPYLAAVTLLAADGAVIATAPPQANVTIGADQVTALAPVPFAVRAGGALALSLSALTTRTNCADPTQGGAGITGNVITLIHGGGSCAAVTFSRSRGTTPLGTYTVDCGSPTVTSCIERDEVLSVQSIDAGPYVIHATALRGFARCWDEFDVLSVAAGGATTTKRLQLAPSGVAGC